MRQVLVERELTLAGPSSHPPRRGGRSVTVNLAESPLNWLRARGMIDDRRFVAGELLRRDYETAQLSAGVTMRWDAVRISGTGAGRGRHASEKQLAAKDRFIAATTAAGSGLSDILWRVVCAGESLVAAEKELAWPTRSGKLVLGLALDRVADFYRVN